MEAGIQGRTYPVSGFIASSSSSGRDHEGQSPALRLVACRIQLRDGICVERLRGRNTLARKIWHVGDLVGEHLVDGRHLEDSVLCCRRDSIVEERCDDFWRASGTVL